MCLVMLAFVLSEAQWEDSIINKQHVINELAFYLVLLHIVVFVGLSPSTSTAAILGWSIIVIVLATIFYNVSVLIYCSICHFKLVFKRFWNRRHLYLISKIYRKSILRRMRTRKIKQQPSMDILPLKLGMTTDKDAELLKNTPV